MAIILIEKLQKQNTLEFFYDNLGKEIKSKNLNQGISKLDLSSYPTGIYFLKITNKNNQIKTVKVPKN